MKKLIKAVAAFTAAATLTMSFAGCGLIKSQKDVDDAKNKKAESAKFEKQLNETVLTVNGEEVNGAYYGWFFQSVKNEMLQAQSATTSSSDSAADSSSQKESKLNLDDVKKEAQRRIVETKTVYKKAMDSGIKLTDEDTANIDNQYEQIRNSVTQQGMNFSNFTTNMDTSSDVIKQIIKEEYIGNLYLASLVKDKFVTAEHILIQFSDQEGGKSKEDAKKEIDEIKTKIDGGEDFDKLMKEKNEDPGLETNPNGYTFCKGQMVEAFETAAFALDENKVSDVVETNYGYHIIKRLPLSVSGIASALANQITDTDVSTVIDAEKDNLSKDAKVTETDAISYYTV